MSFEYFTAGPGRIHRRGNEAVLQAVSSAARLVHRHLHRQHGAGTLKPAPVIIRACLLPLVVFVTSCGYAGHPAMVLHDPARGRDISYRVWVPQGAAERYPLVLLSHGSGGNYRNHQWLIQALVAAGYIVAAPNHPGNTTGDNTDAGVVSVWERPADMRLLLDHLLQDPDWAHRIDPGRIGAAGFSSGGYTVLALGGAIYSREQMSAYCGGPDPGPDCDLVADVAGVDYSASSRSYRDARVKAIFAMAPAVGRAITTSSLETIQTPVFIVAAKDDELLDPVRNAERYADHIPGSQLELLPGGGHFIFFQCDFATRIADWFIRDLDLCGRAFAVDREAVRRSVAARAVEFFARYLGGHTGQLPESAQAP